jgi:hypothetical protein
MSGSKSRKSKIPKPIVEVDTEIKSPEVSSGDELSVELPMAPLEMQVVEVKVVDEIVDELVAQVVEEAVLVPDVAEEAELDVGIVPEVQEKAELEDAGDIEPEVAEEAVLEPEEAVEEPMVPLVEPVVPPAFARVNRFLPGGRKFW